MDRHDNTFGSIAFLQVPAAHAATFFPYTTLFRSSRARIVRQLLSEGLVLAIIAGVVGLVVAVWGTRRSEEHTSELQSHSDLVCRLLLEKKSQSTILNV